VESDEELLGRLRTVPLFKELSEKELKDVAALARVVTFEKDHEIVEEGGGFVGFHLILDGQVAVSQGGGSIGALGPGEYFGEISVLDGKPRTATVTTSSPVRTLSIAARQFLPLLDANPSITRKVLLGLCQIIRTEEARHF
jgi:CRP/FNR family transcriptional regulator, cyclic AMP receptor protein